jgi:hypothetical protein
MQITVPDTKLQRFVWCSWDVEELATGALRKRIEEDFYFLRAGIVGLNAAMLS